MARDHMLGAADVGSQAKQYEILMAYMIEVILGSCPGLYNAELGKDAGCGKRTRLSNREFFFRYLPIMLGVASVLLLLSQFN